MAQWASLAVTAFAVVKFFLALAIGYKTMAGVTWFQAMQHILSLAPKPKKFTDWSPDELQRWWDRAQGQA